MTPQVINVAIGLAVACYSDIRYWKIPNALTFPMMVLGLLVNFGLGTGMVGVMGFAVATVIHFPLYFLGVQKGGDAKMLMALGAFIGWQEVVETTLWEAVVFIPVGFGVLIAMGKLPNLVQSFKYSMAKAKGESAGEPPEQTYMPFAPVIAAAWLLAHNTRWLDWSV